MNAIEIIGLTLSFIAGVGFGIVWEGMRCLECWYRDSEMSDD